MPAITSQENLCHYPDLLMKLPTLRQVFGSFHIWNCSIALGAGIIFSDVGLLPLSYAGSSSISAWVKPVTQRMFGIIFVLSSQSAWLGLAALWVDWWVALSILALSIHWERWQLGCDIPLQLWSYFGWCSTQHPEDHDGCRGTHHASCARWSIDPGPSL